MKIVGEYLLLNGRVIKTKKYNYTKNEKTIYEVIRVINGTPLFLKDHWLRFKSSLELAGLSYDFDLNMIERLMANLISVNNLEGVNLRVELVPDNDMYDIVIFMTKTAIPTTEMLTQGVVVKTYKGKRKDPKVKSEKESYKDILKTSNFKGIYELLFVDENNRILEGSRTNVFFVKKDKIYTAPTGSVLSGITRKYIFEICKKEFISITEKHISMKELEEVESVFLTGTSIGVLKVAKIDEMEFDLENSIVSLLADNYEKYILRDVGDIIYRERKDSVLGI